MVYIHADSVPNATHTPPHGPLVDKTPPRIPNLHLAHSPPAHAARPMRASAGRCFFNRAGGGAPGWMDEQIKHVDAIFLHGGMDVLRGKAVRTYTQQRAHHHCTSQTYAIRAANA
jgi:hypothetical protein